MKCPALGEYKIIKTLSEDSDPKNGFFVVKKDDGNVLKSASLYEIGTLDEETAQKIINQVYVLGSMKHPNIIKFYEAYAHPKEKVIVLVTEHCEKGSLGSLARKACEGGKKEMSYLSNNMRAVIVQMAFALKELSEYEVVHRGINIECVHSDDSGYIRIGNFSMAKLVEDADDQLPDDLKYCPPELFSGEPWSLKSDLWSFGMFLYELLYFDHPFIEFEEDEELLQEKITKCEINYPKEYAVEGQFDDVVAIIKGLLKADPQKRSTLESIIMNPKLTAAKSKLPFPYVTAKNTQGAPKDLLPPYEEAYFPINIPYFNQCTEEWRELRVEHLLNGRDDLNDNEDSKVIKATMGLNNPEPTEEDEDQEEPEPEDEPEEQPDEEPEEEPDEEPEEEPEEENEQTKSRNPNPQDDDSQEEAPKASKKPAPKKNQPKKEVAPKEKAPKEKKPKEKAPPKEKPPKDKQPRYRQIIIPRKVDKIYGLWNNQFTEEILQFKQINYDTLVTTKKHPVRQNAIVVSTSVDRANTARRDRERSILMNSSKQPNAKSVDKNDQQQPGRGAANKQSGAVSPSNESLLEDKLKAPHPNYLDSQARQKNLPGKYTDDGKKLKVVDIKDFGDSKYTDINEYNRKKQEARENEQQKSPKKKPAANEAVYKLDRSELPLINKKR